MTALLRERLVVSMPAGAVSHVRLIPRWETLAPGILEFVPPLCSTRLPAFVCACGERRLLLEWPDGRREWQTDDGRYVLETPRYQVEYSDRGRPRRLLFLSDNGPPRLVGFGWTERAASNFYLREPARGSDRCSLCGDTFPIHSDRTRTCPGRGIAVEVPEAFPVMDVYGLRAVVEADTVEALLDYAREGNERDFRDLAAMSGVPLAQLDKLWQGTRARLHQGGAA